jgi:hypothetical protein
MTMVLQAKQNGNHVPHPEGIYPAVCLDVIDLGLVEVEFQGQRRLVPKVRVVFESEEMREDGRRCTISKRFTASLHPKSNLAGFLGKWRGRPITPGESIDLGKLIGACCTLVVSHQQSQAGQTYAAIDAISKPTKRVVPSGEYDPVAARQRIEEARAREAGAPAKSQGGVSVGQYSGVPVGVAQQPTAAAAGQPVNAGAVDGTEDVGF